MMVWTPDQDACISLPIPAREAVIMLASIGYIRTVNAVRVRRQRIGAHPFTVQSHITSADVIVAMATRGMTADDIVRKTMSKRVYVDKVLYDNGLANPSDPRAASIALTVDYR